MSYLFVKDHVIKNADAGQLEETIEMLYNQLNIVKKESHKVKLVEWIGKVEEQLSNNKKIA